MSALTLEQKIIKKLALQGYITNVGDVTTALEDNEYAKKLITGNDVPGLDDEINGSGGSDTPAECNHEALTNEEIQEVFDNDEETNN